MQDLSTISTDVISAEYEFTFFNVEKNIIFDILINSYK